MTAMLPLIARIADALDRLAPPSPPEADPADHMNLYWDGVRLAAVSPVAALPLERFVGVDAQMAALVQGYGAHARGLPSHDCLLWGACPREFWRGERQLGDG